MSRKVTTAPRPPGTGVRAAIIGIGAVVVALILVDLGFLVVHRTIFATPPIPTLQGTVSAVGLPVDGIPCNSSEKLAYHRHQHILMYYGRRLLRLPSAIGIPGGEGMVGTQCLYWIHTHSSTPNIIHIESPIHRTFTLGDFFDIWRVTQSSALPPGAQFVTDVKKAAAAGTLHVTYNGRTWTRNYRNVPLTEHADIVVQIGGPPVHPPRFTDWSGL